MAGQGRNYFANHVVAPQILQGTPSYNVEVSEGINPPGEFLPAHYLPTVVSENRIGGSYYVLMSGKVVSMDTKGRLIPAGIGRAFTANDTSTHKYSANDVGAGFTNAAGALIAAGDSVVTGMKNKSGLGVTDPVGIMRYSELMAPGTSDMDPSSYWKHSYDTGGSAAFTRWGYIQVPIIETNVREEAIQGGSTDFRVALYPNTSGITMFVGATAVTATQKASPRDLTMLAGVGSTPTEYAVVGRTFFVNSVVPTGMTVRYTPQLDLPFTVLTSSGAPSANIITTSSQYGMDYYMGKRVSYDSNSNFQVRANSDERIGQILDIKEGSSADLKLVRTYFRDFGLWQEMPGSATDGRNAMLSIANAPKYIARIAINFNVPTF